MDNRVFATEAELVNVITSKVVETLAEVEPVETDITAEVATEEQSSVAGNTEESTVTENAKDGILTETYAEQVSVEETATAENSGEYNTTNEETAEITVDTSETVADENIIAGTEAEETPQQVNTWDGLTTEKIYETEDYSIIFTLVSHWSTGYQATVKIENTGENTIENWHLGFAYRDAITNIWNAQILNYEEDTYTIGNAGWNQDIAPGNCVAFGIMGSSAFAGFPETYELMGDSAIVEEEAYTVEYSADGEWGSGCMGTITIMNRSDTVLEDWVLEFDYDRKITNLWNGVIQSREGNHYVVRNAGYNSNLAAGQSISIGFNGGEGTGDEVPENYALYSYSVGGNVSDVIPGDGTEDVSGNGSEDDVGDTEKDSEDNSDDVSKEEIDINLDTDYDNAPDYVEEYFGTDVTKEDTDGDGLSDYEELFSLTLDPLSLDTDGNGVSDSEEDTDGDGLTNLREMEIGSGISKPDTDGDDLTDYEEAAVYGTSPLLADTDGDGVSDAGEIRFSTNPLVYEETFDITSSATEADTVKATVQLVLSGQQAESLSVKKYENTFFFPDTMPGYLGGAYDFTVDGSFETATISFTFDAAWLGMEGFDPVIYYFNEETQLLEELDTTVNGNVASTQVTHFSKYILLNRTVYEEAFSWRDVWSTTEEELYTAVELVFVTDESGSMITNDWNNLRLSVAKKLVDSLPENSKVGVVKFADNVKVLTETLTEEKEQAKTYLATDVPLIAGTRMYQAVREAFSLFETEDATTLKMLVVLNDGSTSDSRQHSTVVELANEQNIKIYTVGLGSSTVYFENNLKPLAEETGGAFYYASNADQLADIYSNIGEKIDIETDSDEDGLPDYYEENLVMFNGLPLVIDKNNPDTDGDGLLDGEEVAELNYQYNADKTQVIVTGKLLSNPLLEDSDGDGLTDEEEIYYFGTDPLRADTDGDGLTDCVEVEEWFDPLEADGDGDGRLDWQEYMEGTSPYTYDKDWYEYLWDFVCGFIAGDFIHETDSVATMMGQVISSFVPLVDIRDVAGNLVHGDYAFAGLSVVGLLPYAGDGVKAGGKVVKFVIKNVDDLPMVMKLFESLLKNCPDLVADLGKSDEFAEMVEALAKADTSKLTKSEAEVYEQFLKKAGVSEDVIKDGTKIAKEIISESDAAKKWGVLSDGTNQGVKHFCDYWEKYPERIPSLEQRLGLEKGSFNSSLEGFNNFTLQAERVVNEATVTGNVKNINGKSIYYIDGISNPKKGVIVIMRDGKFQSMMPSDLKSFNKMQ